MTTTSEDLQGAVKTGEYLDEQPVPQMPILERGKFYDSIAPNGEKVIVMLEGTWIDFGTNVQTLRQALSNAAKKLKEAEIGEKILLARLADVQNRLDNLRAIRRDEKRPEVEAALGMSPNQATQG